MSETPQQRRARLQQIESASRILSILQSRVASPEGFDFAFVAHGETVFWVAVEKPRGDFAFVRPFSAITYLLQMLFDWKMDHSFFILRNRIFSTEKVSDMDRGMVKIIAKRLSGELRPFLADSAAGSSLEIAWAEESRFEYVDLRTLSAQVPQYCGPFQKMNEMNRRPLAEVQQRWQEYKQRLEGLPESEIAEDFLKWLCEQVPRGEVLHDHDRPIAGLLLSSSGELLSYGVNSNSINKSLHAEVLLLQRYYRESGGQALPKGVRLYVTHRPCRMCAGMLYRSLGEPSEVPKVAFYYTDMPGVLNYGASTDGLLVSVSSM